MRYKAFISYSHAADGKLAPAIQRALHRIAKPWYKLRTMRVFRDQTNLATSPGLWTAIESALRDAEFFVYLASPTAAQSPWVQKEVSWWLTNRSQQSFLILLSDGEIVWDNANQDLNWTTTTALPRQLSKAFAEEPLYTDLRWARSVDQLSPRNAQFRTVLLDLAATLLNRPKDELDGDDIRQYRRTRRIAWSGVIVLLVLFVAALLAAYFATQQSMLATARALSAQSEAVLPTDPELALLLAREALKYREDDQAEFALRQAFIRNPQRMIHHSPSGRTLHARFVGSNTVVIAELPTVADEPNKTASVWDVATGQRVADLPTEVGEELRMGQSSDSSIIVIPFADGSSYTLYETKTWKSLPSLPGTDARISRDGKVLTAVDGNKVRQWTLPSLSERSVKASVPEGYSVLDVSKDGSLLLLTNGSEMTSGLVVDTASGQTLATIPERLFRTGSGFSPDGRFVITQQQGDKEAFELWNAQSGSLVRTLQEGFDVGWISFVAFSPDAKTFVAGDREGRLQGWNVETGEQFRMQSSQRNAIDPIRFSPDGETMLSVAAEGTVCVWDTENMRCLVTLGGKGDEVFDAAFASDSRHFLTTHMDGSVRVWDRHVWQPIQTLPYVKTVVSDDGSLALGANETGHVTLWDAENGQVKTTLQQTPSEIQCMALNAATSLIAIAPTEGVVALWNAQTGESTIRLDKSSAETTALAFDSTGGQLATGSKNGTVRFWNTSDGRLLGEWQATQNEVNRIIFHPDGERVFVADGESCQVRERNSGATVLQVGDDSGVAGLALNADGSLLMVTGDTLPQIWNLKAQRRVETLEGHSDGVASGAFSSDGRWILTGSGYMRGTSVAPPDDASSVFVWDAKTRRQLLSYRSAASEVEIVHFVKDGSRIFAGERDGKVRRYECAACVPLPELLKLVSTKISRELTADERARYVSDGTLLGWLLHRLAS